MEEERYKAVPRDAETVERLQKRLRRVTGQLGGIARMLEENRYCGDILIQLAAAESALQALGYEILQEHMESCVTSRIRAGDAAVVQETMDLIKRLK